jgi:hypothetical protein
MNQEGKLLFAENYGGSIVNRLFLVQGLWLVMAGLAAGPLCAQEQVDKLQRLKAGPAAVAKMSMRVRVAQCAPAQNELVVRWRRGGEGLGGEVVRGQFVPEGAEPLAAIDLLVLE